MDTPLKSVSEKPLKNSTEEQEITALEHKCAQCISDELSTGLKDKMGEQMDGNTRLCMFFAETSLFDFRIFYFLERCHRYCRGWNAMSNFLFFSTIPKNIFVNLRSSIVKTGFLST